MDLMLEALHSVMEHGSARQQEAVIFESLEEMLHSSATDSIYSSSTNSRVATIIASLKLKGEVAQQQAIVCYFLGKKPTHPNSFAFLLQKNNEQLINENSQASYSFIKSMLEKGRGYYDMERVAYLLSQVTASKGDIEAAIHHLNTILSCLKKYTGGVQAAESMLTSILVALPTRAKIEASHNLCRMTEKCIRKIIVITAQ